MDDPTGTPVAPPAPPAPPVPSGTGADRPDPVNDTSKLLAALGYIFWIVALIAILIEPYKEEKFVRFHAVQALALGVAAIVAWAIPIIGWIVGIAILVFQIIGLIKAFQSQYYEVPVVYGLVKSFIDG
ncbi:MAG: hypothetical protein U1E29_04660 [Coriobacteriia bacterium]|nr:hypothetical protein [Coriobacteriia bacterium]